MAGESLTGTYTANSDAKDRAELEAWWQQRMARPKPPPPPAAVPPPPKPSAIEAGVSAAGESISHGAQKVYDTLLSSKPPTTGVGPIARAKDLVDGLIGMTLGAAGAGLGAAGQQQLQNISPELASKVLLPGGKGGLAPLVRGMLGSPAFSSTQTGQERVANEAPMTVGEALNAATALGTMIGLPKVVGRAVSTVRGKPKAPAPVTESVSEPVLETQAAAAEANRRAMQNFTGAPAEGGLTGPERIAGELQGAYERQGELAARQNFTGAAVEGGMTAAERAVEGEAVRLAETIQAETAASAAEFRGRQAEVAKAQEGVAEGQAAAKAVGESTGRAQAGKLEETLAATPDEPARPDLPGTPEVVAAEAETMLAEAKKAGGLEALLRDETGAITPEAAGLLARVAIGAAVGCATAEDGEECAKRALIGAGIMAPLSAKFAAAAAQRLRALREKTPEGAPEAPPQRAGVSVQASEQGYQPNYQRLELTPDLKTLMVNVHRSMKEDILAKRGPAKTNDATVKIALENINTDKFTPERVLSIGDQEMLSAEDYTAARILSRRAFEHALETKNRSLAGEAIPEGAVKQQLALAGAMSRNTLVARKRIAQSQQSGNIKIPGEEKVTYRPEDVAYLADQIMPEWTDQQVSMLFANVKTPAQIGRVATFLSLFPRMALQAMYFSYLSGKAIGRNLVGNTSMMSMDVMDTGIGRWMPRWDSSKPGILPGEATVRARAMGEALIDHVRMIRHLDELDATAARLGFGDAVRKSERRAPAFREMAQQVGGAVEGETLDSLGRWADNITTFTSEALDKTDIASKSINGQAELHSQAMYQAVREGHSGPAFDTRVAELVNDVTQLNRSARQAIVDHGERQTFTKEFEGRLLRAMAQGPENEWLNLVYRGAVMPFFRVTARMMEQTMLRTPGLNLVAKQFWEDWHAGGVQRQKAQARVVGGAAVISSFMYLESQGLVTGNKPDDPAKAALWDAAGYKERSWRLPGSERWRSYDGLGPLTSLVATGADTSMAIRHLPDGDVPHQFFSYLMSTIDTLDSRTFTQTASNLMDVFKNQGSDTQVEKAMDFVRRQVSSWAKPAVVREIESVVDPEVRKPVRSGKFAEDTLGGALQREYQLFLDEIRVAWPSWSSAKDAEGNDKVPASRDPITGDKTIVESWPFHPFPGVTLKHLPFDRPDNMPKNFEADVRKELLRLNGGGLSKLDPWMGGSNPGSGAGFSSGNLREGIRLSGPAHDRRVELMTQVVTDDAGETYAQALKTMMESPYYWDQNDGSRGTDGGKAVLLRSVEAVFQQRADEQLQEEAPIIRRKLDERKIERKLQTVPTEQQQGVRESIPGAAPAPLIAPGLLIGR